MTSTFVDVCVGIWRHLSVCLEAWKFLHIPHARGVPAPVRLACLHARLGWTVSYLPQFPCAVCVCCGKNFAIRCARAHIFFLHVCKHAEQHHHRLSAYIYLSPFLFSPLWLSETSHNLPPSLPCQWCRHFQELFLISPTSWATPRVTRSWTRNPVPIRINTEIWAAPPMCLNPAAAPLEYWCVHAGRLGGERRAALLSYQVDSFHLYSVVGEIIFLFIHLY